MELFNQAKTDELADLYRENAVNHQVANVPVACKENIRNMFRNAFAVANGSASQRIFLKTVTGEWIDFGFFPIKEGKILFQPGYWDKRSFLRLHHFPLPE